MKDYEKWEVGNRIRQEMNKQGFTQTALSQVIHVDQTSISKWVTGKQLPPTESLVDVAKALKVSIDWLLTGVSTDNITATSELGLSNDAIESLKNTFNQSTDAHFAIDLMVTTHSGFSLLDSISSYLIHDGTYLAEGHNLDIWKNVFPEDIPVTKETIIAMRDTAHLQSIMHKLEAVKDELNHARKGDEK